MYIARTPIEALRWLNKEGFQKALIGSGSKLNGAFLSENLIHQIIIDVEPIMFASGKPFCSVLPSDLLLTLQGMRQTGPNSLQVKYLANT